MQRETGRLKVLFPALLAATILLSACMPSAGSKATTPAPTGNSSGNAAGTSKDAPGPVQIEIDAGQNALPFQWQQDNIKQKLGLDFNIVGLPFVGQYEKMVSEFISRSGAYDLVVFPPQDLGDFVAKGFLRPLDDYAAKWDPQLSDVIPPYRDPNLKRNGHLYALPYDGDIHLLYYRKDLFNDPKEKAAFKAKYGYDLAAPTTWDQYRDIAEFFTRPPEMYGTAFYGQRGFSYGWWTDVFAGLGGKWFDDKSMKATINSDAGVKALQTMLDWKKYSPPDVLSYGYDELRDAFTHGKVAMIIQWSDVGKKANDPKQSTIVGKVGFSPVPGGRSAMPYSRVMAVAADSKRPEAAYRIAQYMTSPDVSITYVTNPADGEDSYRFSQLKDGSLYKTIPGADAQAYVDALKVNIEHGYPELSIPGGPRYLDLLDQYINQALAGQLQPKQALDLAAREWDNLTDQVGKDAQLQAYHDWTAAFQAAGVKY